MTCPACGTIAANGVERCQRCGHSMARPEHPADFPIPVLRAPTQRGVDAQRAAGIVTTVLATPRPPAPPSVAYPTPVADERPARPPAPVGPPAPVTGWAAPDPGTVSPGAPPSAYGGPLPPPPAGPTYNVGVSAGEARRPEISPFPVPTDAAARRDEAAHAAADPTVVSSFAVPPPPPGAAYDPTGVLPAEEARDDHRPRLEKPWPPPPGPWSGRRSTSES